MFQRRENFGLPLESRHAFGIAAEFIGQDFDGDFAFQLGVARAVDFTHPALAEQGRDLMRAELCTDRQGQR